MRDYLKKFAVIYPLMYVAIFLLKVVLDFKIGAPNSVLAFIMAIILTAQLYAKQGGQNLNSTDYWVVSVASATYSVLLGAVFEVGMVSLLPDFQLVNDSFLQMALSAVLLFVFLGNLAFCRLILPWAVAQNIKTHGGKFK